MLKRDFAALLLRLNDKIRNLDRQRFFVKVARNLYFNRSPFSSLLLTVSTLNCILNRQVNAVKHAVCNIAINNEAVLDGRLLRGGRLLFDHEGRLKFIRRQHGSSQELI